MSLVVGVLLGAGLATVIGIGWALLRAPRAARTPAAIGMQSALHAATSTLPHLRAGPEPQLGSRGGPAPAQRSPARRRVALADTRAVLAIDGEGGEQVRPGDLL